jgi:magnesium-transporting ATPase (P-type)
MHDKDEATEISENELDDAAKYAAKGFKVICYAYVEMTKDSFDQIVPRGEDDDSANAVFRERLEEGGYFTGFRLLATFALKDGLRATAASAVQYARAEAGLRVRLVSNDHVDTAKNIAKRAGILNAEEMNDDDCVMTGAAFDEAVGTIVRSQAFDGEDGEYDELERMEEFTRIASKLKVLARASSDVKRKLVIGLQASGIATAEIKGEDDKSKF